MIFRHGAHIFNTNLVHKPKSSRTLKSRTILLNYRRIIDKGNTINTTILVDSQMTTFHVCRKVHSLLVSKFLTLYYSAEIVQCLNLRRLRMKCVKFQTALRRYSHYSTYILLMNFCLFDDLQQCMKCSHYLYGNREQRSLILWRPAKL